MQDGVGCPKACLIDAGSATLDYYDANVQPFCDSTVSVEFSEMHNRFLGMFPKGASVLDFGCGSGRDAKRFVDGGYGVSATDGSELLCGIV